MKRCEKCGSITDKVIVTCLNCGGRLVEMSETDIHKVVEKRKEAVKLIQKKKQKKQIREVIFLLIGIGLYFICFGISRFMGRDFYFANLAVSLIFVLLAALFFFLRDFWGQAKARFVLFSFAAPEFWRIYYMIIGIVLYGFSLYYLF